ncbi:hypothetical protein MKX01_027664 [Papaver californicum]|nr:hypothetical protein MKX01_027664 [Papaver californicum]
MRGHVSNEFDVVGASADEIWAVYGDKNLPNHVSSLQPGLFEKLENKKFTTIDDCKMVKQVTQVEGGFLGIGFKLHEVTFEILPKGKDSSNASDITVDSMYGTARAITKYVLDNKAKA